MDIPPLTSIEVTSLVALLSALLLDPTKVGAACPMALFERAMETAGASTKKLCKG